MFPNNCKRKINSLVGSGEGNTPSSGLVESFLRFTDVCQSDSFAFYFFFFFLVGGELLYNIVVVFVIH